jgi:hypothetical protein
VQERVAQLVDGFCVRSVDCEILLNEGLKASRYASGSIVTSLEFGEEIDTGHNSHRCWPQDGIVHAPGDVASKQVEDATTKKSRRVAEFDWVQLRKAALLNGPTDIALTFADYVDAKNKDARRFEQLTEKTIQFIEEVENVAAAPVSLVSTRFGFRF